MRAVPYEPWAMHRALFNEFNRAAERKAGDAPAGGWTPAVDIEEHGDKFVIQADVPGVDPASIEITLEKGVLTLAGRRERPAAPAGVTRCHSERAEGRFLRRFALPDTADAEAVSASNRHGVLQIVIPKRAQAQPRKISVTH